MADKQRSLSRRLLQGIPIPMFVIVFGLVFGITVWLITDYYQTEALSKIFKQTMDNQLHQRARESLIHFDNLIHNYSAKARLLAQHRKMSSYLDPRAWLSTDEDQVRDYQDSSPDWMFDGDYWDGLLLPEQIILLDMNGRIREVYSTTGEEISPALEEFSFSYDDGANAYVTKMDQRAYLVITDLLEDSTYNPMGVLLFLIPVDSDLLVFSQKNHRLGTTLLALLDEDSQQVLASSDLTNLAADSHFDPTSSRHVLTLQALYGYEGADTNILFATLVPRNEIEQIGQQVLDLERRQRLIGSLAMLAVFVILFVIVSNRLNRILRRISQFSHRALGLQRELPVHGNQLLILEDWVREFILLVQKARDEVRAQHESEIRESEVLKSALLDTSLDSIISIDQMGAVVDFNPTAEQTFGHDAQSVIGQNFEDLILDQSSHHAFKEQLYDALLLSHEGEEVVRQELTAIKADNKPFPVELAIKPMLLVDRLLFTVYIHDISQRKGQEAEIRTLAAFPSESPIPVLRVNRPGVIIYANAPSEPLLEYWGCGRAQTLPIYWKGVVQSVLDSDEMLEMELKTDTAIFSLLMAPIKDLGYVNIYARDITQTMAAQNEARQRQNELIHVARLSTMGEMATGIAHELNQPLAAIVNYASGCVRRIHLGIDGKDDLLEALEQIRGQANRAGEIIKRLRSMVSRQQSIREWKNLNHLVMEVCALMQNESNRLEIVVERKFDVDQLMVSVDPVLIEQAILNLVRNALDALATIASSQRRLVIATGIQPNGMAFVSIQDNGPGVSQKVLGHLFDPFFSTKEKGMGMGLAITQTIVSEHNGKIRAESWPNKGTIFTIELPIAEEMSESMAS